MIQRATAFSSGSDTDTAGPAVGIKGGTPRTFKPQLRLVLVRFETEDENDAMEIAEDIALLEGIELICLSKCH